MSDLESALRSRFTEADGCWEWTGFRKDSGYGMFTFRGRTMLAHRWVWDMLVGDVDAVPEFDHLCRNRACVNPEHLEPVDHAENMRRAELRTPRHRNIRKTSCPKGHLYSGSNLIVRTDKHGRRRRYCRTCSTSAAAA